MTAHDDAKIHTVTTEAVRGAAGLNRAWVVQPEEFDRWLAAHDAQILDRIARHFKATVRLGLGLTEEQKQDRRNIIEWLEGDRDDLTR